MVNVTTNLITAGSTGRLAELRCLGPLVLIVFLGFLSIGVPLSALSLQVHEVLGFDMVTVGWVIGIQSLATILTRHRAGTLADHRGPRRAVLTGLPLAAASGLLYLASTLLPLAPAPALAVLTIARLVLGVAESLFITGCMSWGIARLGPARTGKVMSWQGIAMYAALGLGAPLGLAVQRRLGFEAVALLVVATPLLACLVALALPGTPPSAVVRAPFHRVLGLIWRPGTVLMLATAPFAVLATFLALSFAARGWDGAGWALGGFAAGYVLVRLLFAHLPDRLGGITVATVSLAIEAAGQAMLWLAPVPSVALAGAVLTGIGFSLMFPSMGIEATRRVAPALRGRAVGGFTAFFDLALGLTGPLVGLATSRLGLDGAFLLGTGAALAGLAMLPLVRRMPPVAVVPDR